MSQKDFYKILGVHRSAADADIKKQYRKLARKYHPDVSKLANAEAHFKEVNEAYDVLKDKEKRSNYDQFGSADGNPFGGSGGFRPPPRGSQGGNFEGAFGQGGFDDLFGSMFGNSRGGQGDPFSAHRQVQKGQDQSVSFSVDLEDSYNGVERPLHIHIPGTDGAKKLKVKIPKGIKDGQKIRLSGQGSPGSGTGAPNGDLFIEIKFNRHKYFTIDGKDIHLVLPISPWEAALGTKLSIPTLGGTVEMKFSENTPGGKKMRLKGRGLPGKIAGDQYITIQIMTPKADSDELKELYQKMAEISQFKPRNNF